MSTTSLHVFDFSVVPLLQLLPALSQFLAFVLARLEGLNAYHQ